MRNLIAALILLVSDLIAAMDCKIAITGPATSIRLPLSSADLSEKIQIVFLGERSARHTDDLDAIREKPEFGPFEMEYQVLKSSTNQDLILLTAFGTTRAMAYLLIQLGADEMGLRTPTYGRVRIGGSLSQTQMVPLEDLKETIRVWSPDVGLDEPPRLVAESLLPTLQRIIPYRIFSPAAVNILWAQRAIYIGDLVQLRRAHIKRGSGMVKPIEQIEEFLRQNNLSMDMVIPYEWRPQVDLLSGKDLQEVLPIPIETLKLSWLVRQFLANRGVEKLGQLIQMSESDFDNNNILVPILALLRSMHLDLGMEVP